MEEFVFIPDNILITKGAFNCCILDTLRRKIISVNSELISFIEEVNCKKISTYKRFSNNVDLALFRKLLNKLIEEGILIKSNINPKKYISKRQLLSGSPTFNSILELDLRNRDLVLNTIIFIHKNNIKYLECRIFNAINAHEIINLLSIMNFDQITSLDLKIDLPNVVLASDFIFEISKHIEISAIYLYSRNENLKLENITPTYTFTNKLTKERCGQCNMNLFNSSELFYTESLHHNSCLNRKISIDAEGNIKNCPSMPESFGNIKDTTLAEAIEKPGFKKYWNITKDQIAVCKDCEFRYICTDCRAYKEDPDDDYSKPLKCGYDPYTGVWSEWSKNPLKQKAIQYYGMEEIIKQEALSK